MIKLSHFKVDVHEEIKNMFEHVIENIHTTVYGPIRVITYYHLPLHMA